METLEKINSAREVIYEKLGQLDDLKAGEKRVEQVKQELLSQVEVLEELEYYSEKIACELVRKFVPKRLFEIYDEYSVKILKTFRENYQSIKQINL